MHNDRNDEYYADLKRRSEELLIHYEVVAGHDFASLFVLGSHEAVRVTVPSQQIRAIKLIDALWGRLEAEAFKRAEAEGKLNEMGFPGESHSLHGRKILVVGAGAGGLTAAAFAAQHGADIMVVDRAPEILDRIRRSERLLHPRLYEWGSPQGFEVEDRSYIKSPEADLPVLDWKKGPAKAVAEDLARQWEGWARAYGIQERFGVTARSQEDRISFHRCAESSGCTSERGCADEVAGFAAGDAIVILACGFGEEDRQIGAQGRLLGLTQDRFLTYWDAEDPDQDLGRFENRKVMVCGNGDGAINELFRLTLVGFSQTALVDWIKEFDSDHKLETAVEQIERQLVRTPHDAINEAARMDVARQYLNLPHRLVAALDASVGKRLKASNDIILSVRGPKDSPDLKRNALASYAFPLNKVILASVLRQLEAKGGRFQIRRDPEIDAIPAYGAGRYIVMRSGAAHPPDQPVLGRNAGPLAAEQLQQLRQVTAGHLFGVRADITRIPEWTRLGERPNPSRQTVDAYVPRRRSNREDATRAEIFDHIREFTLVSDLFDSTFQVALADFETRIGNDDVLDDFFLGALRTCFLFNDRILLTDAQFWDGPFMLRLGNIFAKLDKREQELFRDRLEIRRRDLDRHIPDLWARKKDFAYSSLSPQLNRAIAALDCDEPGGIKVKLARAIEAAGYAGTAYEEESYRAIDNWCAADRFVTQLPHGREPWPYAAPWNVDLRYENIGEVYRYMTEPDRTLLLEGFARRPSPQRGDRTPLVNFLNQDKAASSDPETVRDWFNRAYNRMTALSQGASVYVSLFAGKPSDEAGRADAGRASVAGDVSIEAIGALASEEFMELFDRLDKKAKRWMKSGDPRRKAEIFQELGARRSGSARVLESGASKADNHLIRKLRAFSSVECFAMSIVSQREAGPTNRALGWEENPSANGRIDARAEFMQKA